MGRMYFDDIITDLFNSFDGIYIVPYQRLYHVFIKLRWRRFCGFKRDVRHTYRLPPVRLIRRDLLPAFPREFTARLSPRMGKLYAHLCTLLMNEIHNLPELHGLFIIPDPK